MPDLEQSTQSEPSRRSTPSARPGQTIPSPRHPTHSVDRAFLNLERRRPDVRWDAGGVAYLSGPPPALADLRAYVGFRLGLLPLLTSRVEGGRRSRWQPDADFDVDLHVHEVVADGPAAWDSALHTALNAPFQPGAYWGVWLIHGHEPDAYAVCYRFHHACQDGSAAAMTFRAMLGEGSRPRARYRAGAVAPGCPGGWARPSGWPRSSWRALSPFGVTARTPPSPPPGSGGCGGGAYRRTPSAGSAARAAARPMTCIWPHSPGRCPSGRPAPACRFPSDCCAARRRTTPRRGPDMGKPLLRPATGTTGTGRLGEPGRVRRR